MNRTSLIILIIFILIPLASGQSYEITSLHTEQNKYSPNDNITINYDITAEGEGVVYGDVKITLGENNISSGIAISDGLTMSESQTLKTPTSLGEPKVTMEASANNQESTDTKTHSITIESDTEEEIEAEVEEKIKVVEGDTLVFGENNQNEFRVDEVYRPSNIEGEYFEFIPGIGTNTISDSERIVFPDRNSFARHEEIGFETGEFEVYLHEINAEENSAKVELIPEYSESSSFDCENYDLEENQYAFCINQGESAEQEIDLGSTTETFNFVSNSIKTMGGEDYKATRFTNTEINHGESQEYKGANIDVIDWRGLSSEYNGEGQQVIIEVDPIEQPEASIDFSKNQYSTGEDISLEFEIFESGKYEVEVSGAGISESKSYETNDNGDNLQFKTNEEGTIQAEVIAPGSRWNPLSSDKSVDTASTEIERPIKEINHEFGDKITLEEGETTMIEGKSFYLSHADTGIEVNWRPEEDGSTISPLNLKRPQSMGFRYQDDNFDPYGYLCSLDVDSQTAEIIIKEDRENPWSVCNRHPSDYRSQEPQQDYDIQDYELGRPIELEEGQALEFGESRAYLESIAEIETNTEERLEFDGHQEWIADSPYWHPPTEGSSVEDFFYEGVVITGTCSSSKDSIEIVMERSEDISSNYDWPEDWCDEDKETIDERTEKCTYDIAGIVHGVEYQSDKTQKVYYNVDGEENNFTSLSSSEEFDWTQNAECGSTQELVYQENNETKASAEIKLPGTGRSVETELQVEYAEEISTEEPRMSVNKDQVEIGENLNIDIELPESIASNGYKVSIEDAEGETFWEQSEETTEVESTIKLDEDYSAGEYTVKLKPNMSLTESLLEFLTGSNTLAETSFEVISPQNAWKSFCTENGYNTDNAQDQITCITDEVVPQYFEDSTGEEPEIAESLCQNLLNLDYNTNTQKCERLNYG